MRENPANVREASSNSTPADMQTQQNASSSVAQSLNELQGRARGESEHQSEKQGPFDLERDLDAPSRETEHADCVSGLNVRSV